MTTKQPAPKGKAQAEPKDPVQNDETQTGNEVLNELEKAASASGFSLGEKQYDSLFDGAVDLMIFKEGGDKLHRHPRDPGKLTKYGISSRAYPHLDIASLTREAATDIYRQDYFKKAGCDELPERLAILVFGSAINQGVAASVTMLQQAVNDCLGDIASDNGFTAFMWPEAREAAQQALSEEEITPLKRDGVTGPKTLKAVMVISHFLPVLLVTTFARMRAWRYGNTVGGADFLKGWLDRLFDVSAAAETVQGGWQGEALTVNEGAA
jgi:lysozyme family protein